MDPIIDSHTHIFPQPVLKILDRVGQMKVGGDLPSKISTDLSSRLELFRKKGRSALQPLSETIHKVQPLLRYFPPGFRKNIEQFTSLLSLPPLLFEANSKDLIEALRAAGIHGALLIPHPPQSSNEEILELSQEVPEFFPVIFVPQDQKRPSAYLRSMMKKGGRALKIHPAADGGNQDSPRYKALLRTAEDLGLPVILHTGCIHIQGVYKNPEAGHAELYSPWFKNFKDVRFILAHMNFHFPNVAMDLAEENPNLYLETSWQPTETIMEAIKRLGPERILFGSDWPLIGKNIEVSLNRVKDGIQWGFLTENDAEMVLGKNAIKLFNLPIKIPCKENSSPLLQKS
jgi:uncharacterized protein